VTTAPSPSCAASSATGPRASTTSGRCSSGPVAEDAAQLGDGAVVTGAADGRRVGLAPPPLDDALDPYGKPLYAGLAACDRFDDPLADAWRLADRLREYRGDAHVAAWTSAGVDACQIGVLSELYWGLPARSYSRTRMWSDDQYDAAEAALEERGLLSEQQLTAEGRAFREEVEVATDRQCRPIVDALGDDHGRLVEVLSRWAASIRSARGYPASGPHDLADAATARLP
jgi:hypothetical protein